MLAVTPELPSGGENLRRLVIVPGHGICREGCTSPQLAALDRSWIGAHPREAELLVQHMTSGVREAAMDPLALLVFSGGQTRVAAGPRAEGLSYLEVARNAAFWGEPAVSARVASEEYARDSFENLLASVARFAQASERWPERVTVVGWGFKAERFTLHARALGFDGRFHYISCNQPRDLTAARAGEDEKLRAVRLDPLCRGPRFSALRAARDPFARGLRYEGIDPALDDYLATLARGRSDPSPPWNPG